MTIELEESQEKHQYSVNGTYTVGFRVIDGLDVFVEFACSDTEDTFFGPNLEEEVDYEVTVNQDQTIVKLLRAPTPPDLSSTCQTPISVWFRRATVAEQQVHFLNNCSLEAEVQELSLDALTVMVQDIWQMLSERPTVFTNDIDMGPEGFDNPAPKTTGRAPIAIERVPGGYLRWDDNGEHIICVGGEPPESRPGPELEPKPKLRHPQLNEPALRQAPGDDVIYCSSGLWEVTTDGIKKSFPIPATKFPLPRVVPPGFGYNVGCAELLLHWAQPPGTANYLTFGARQAPRDEEEDIRNKTAVIETIPAWVGDDRQFTYPGFTETHGVLTYHAPVELPLLRLAPTLHNTYRGFLPSVGYTSLSCNILVDTSAMLVETGAVIFEAPDRESQTVVNAGTEQVVTVLLSAENPITITSHSPTGGWPAFYLLSCTANNYET